MATVVLLAPALLLALWSVVTLRRATATAGRLGWSAAVTRLLLVAGIGTMVCAVVASAAFWSDAQYGVLRFPIIGVGASLVWTGLCKALILAVNKARPPADRR